MSGCLYLVATPIGNLEDMTYRAVRVLSEVDIIAAEDTRNSIKLLNHFDIKTPMTSYHEHNKYEKATELVGKLVEGKSIAVITDAGTPGISDPGEELVKQCYEAGVKVVPIPGACAAINAVIASGLPTRRFSFEAFLPSEKTDKKERRHILEELKSETRTMIIYEAPHRLLKTLKELYGTLGNRRATICRELTKKHETFFVTTLEEAIYHYEATEPKGECIIVVEGLSREAIIEEARSKWDEMTVEEHITQYINQGIDKKEAVKQVAKDRGLPKREIYDIAKNM
ncbi:MAG: 16S rRNA (cytidine(1402)-2'-O)-methyltransferase [Lachnospiraceae bacterium]|nr:16S rRNA (cytidine(1402)-2'-O)-methyltransferase [Lachnospiraceae bacterium]